MNIKEFGTALQLAGRALYCAEVPSRWVSNWHAMLRGEDLNPHDIQIRAIEQAIKSTLSLFFFDEYHDL